MNKRQTILALTRAPQRGGDIMEPTNYGNDTRKTARARHRGRAIIRFGLMCVLVVTVLVAVPQATTASWWNPLDWVDEAWEGIKSGANWVWKGAKTAGEAIQKAASKSWDGAEVLGEWIEEGAEW